MRVLNTGNTIMNKEEKVNRYLRKLKAEKVINESIYSSLYASGSRPGILYGLPKVHKNGCPIRPITSAIGTFNYKLSKFMVPLLAPVTLNQYTVRDSFSFAKEICDFNFGDCVLASFDVKSLFTNIPLTETVDICIDNLFQDQDMVFGFTKQQLHKLLSLAATDCYFLFDEKVFRQKDGVAMGNPLGPTLANAFLAHHEKNWLNDCPLTFKPILYRRYVDDTFLIFRSPLHIPMFLEYMNSRHSNIEFTSDVEEEGKLAFLDISIKHHNGTFSTSVYRKPTFTGLATKTSSFMPIEYKKNLILTLATRAYYICSDYLSLNNEFQYIKRVLVSNGFRQSFVDSFIGRQLEKLLHPKLPNITVKKALIYFPIHFMGKSSFSFKNKLCRLLSEFYPQLNVRVIFKPRRTIQNFFRFKDKVPRELQSSVVYKYLCCCNATYYGRSKRQLQTRIFQHLGRSIRTNRQLSNPPFSAIRQHSEEEDHPIDKDAFTVLSCLSSEMELDIVETLYILRDKPSLCNYERSVNLLCF